MTTLRVGEVRFRIYPQDHHPRHVHAFIGLAEVIVNLRADGSVALACRPDAVCEATRSDVRRVLSAAAEAFDELAAAWEAMHHG